MHGTAALEHHLFTYQQTKAREGLPRAEICIAVFAQTLGTFPTDMVAALHGCVSLCARRAAAPSLAGGMVGSMGQRFLLLCESPLAVTAEHAVVPHLVDVMRSQVSPHLNN